MAEEAFFVDCEGKEWTKEGINDLILALYLRCRADKILKHYERFYFKE